MLGKMRTFSLSLTIIIVLVFSAVSPKNAYADDGKPPKAKATQVTEEAQPAEGGGAVSSDAAQDPQPDATQEVQDPQPVEVTPAAEDAAPTEIAQDPQPTAEVTPSAEEAAPTESAAEAQPSTEAAPAEGDASCKHPERCS